MCVCVCASQKLHHRSRVPTKTAVARVKVKPGGFQAVETVGKVPFLTINWPRACAREAPRRNSRKRTVVKQLTARPGFEPGSVSHQPRGLP